MSFRYAVLWDVDHEKSTPVGIAVEQDDYVLVDVPEEYCIASRHRGGYDVMQPNSTHVTYRPGHPGYFDQVLIDLSSTFAIREQGEVEGDPGSIAALLKEKVLNPLIEQTHGQYTAAHREPQYQPPEPAAPAADPPGRIPVAV